MKISRILKNTQTCQEINLVSCTVGSFFRRNFYLEDQLRFIYLSRTHIVKIRNLLNGAKKLVIREKL